MPGSEWDDVMAQAAAEDTYDQNAIIAISKFCRVLKKMGAETVADVSGRLQEIKHKLERQRRNTAVLLGAHDPEIDDMYRQLIDRIREYDQTVADEVLIPSLSQMFKDVEEAHDVNEGIKGLLTEAVAHARRFRAAERARWAAERGDGQPMPNEPQDSQNGHHDDDVAF